jgi:hypothetical protein
MANLAAADIRIKKICNNKDAAIAALEMANKVVKSQYK